MALMWKLGEALLGGPYLPDDVYMPPCCGGGPSGTVMGVLNRGYHCRWRASVSYSTPSQMCGSWYLPRFLLRGGSLTLMNMASFMVLVMPWDSLSTMENLSSLRE